MWINVTRKVYPRSLTAARTEPTAKGFWLAVLFCATATSGCTALKLPESLGEQQSSYSYIPLDPLPVAEKSRCGGETQLKGVLESLPDQAVRIAVGQYNASGTLVFGPGTVGVVGKSYQIVLDYISVDTANVPVYIKRYLPDQELPDKEGRLVSVYDNTIAGRTVYRIYRDPEQNKSASARMLVPEREKQGFEQVIVPVYVGVGLRLTASVTVTQGTANLSSLGAIAADAEAGKLTGSLIVQTLGITGKSVATSLPLPSELNQTTIQNAILSLGSIKAVLYDQSTVISPRVVGIYNPIGGGQEVVNGIISVLSNQPIEWSRPCVET